jgi:hypothetical protein
MLSIFFSFHFLCQSRSPSAVSHGPLSLDQILPWNLGGAMAFVINRIMLCIIWVSVSRPFIFVYLMGIVQGYMTLRLHLSLSNKAQPTQAVVASSSLKKGPHILHGQTHQPTQLVDSNFYLLKMFCNLV